MVTGASRGVGRQIARSLSKAKATVIASSRNESGVQDVLEMIRSEGGKVHGTTCDVRNYDEVEQLMNFAVSTAGGIDILINNAGVGIFGHLSELSPEDWDQVIGTNLTGIFYCCRAALEPLRQSKAGTIINISSLAGKQAFQGGSCYNASKFGLEGLSEALMLDLRYENIKVAYIMPGSVATEFAGRTPSENANWRLTSQDVADVVLGILAQKHHALASRVELRPFQPPRK